MTVCFDWVCFVLKCFIFFFFFDSKHANEYFIPFSTSPLSLPHMHTKILVTHSFIYIALKWQSKLSCKKELNRISQLKFSRREQVLETIFTPDYISFTHWVLHTHTHTYTEAVSHSHSQHTHLNRGRSTRMGIVVRQHGWIILIDHNDLVVAVLNLTTSCVNKLKNSINENRLSSIND